MERPARGPLLKHRATASSGWRSDDSRVAESKAKNASSAGIRHAVRISSEIAIVPRDGSGFAGVVLVGPDGGVAVAIVGVDGALARGGFAAAHAVTRSSGAIDRTSPDARAAKGFEFMVTNLR